jgi:hypothetical protein
MEEMVHMAIAANILAALGGSPQIKTIRLSYPTHGLPGGAEPELRVGLAQLSHRQLENFMSIERPEFLLRQMNQDQAYPTIALFYTIYELPFATTPLRFERRCRHEVPRTR